jgi:CheY-like chemotaxis protein
LLTNAAKYTDRNGRIELEAGVVDDELKVVISDNGIGVKLHDLPRLFEMFSQVSSAVDRSEGGLGIGLALSKGLLDLHGGKVAAHSRGLGQGMTFVVTLPIAEGVHDISSIRQIAASNEMAGMQHHGRTILLIDDNRDAIDCLSVILQITGYRVFVAYSGAEGLAIGEREKPQLVVLDIGMPKMNGYEVARRIRSASWGKNVLLVAATGWGQDADKRLAFEAGFDHHLTKPFDPKDALAALRQWQKEKSIELESE